MIRVLIADDFPIIRQGIIQTLAETGDIEVADEVGSGQELIGKVQEKDYDVIVLDISMPGRGGLETLKQLKTLKPKIPVLILSMHPEEQYAIRAMKSGASGYVNKGKDLGELVEAIRRVASGRKYVSETLAENLAMAIDQNHDGPLHISLSDREFEVFRKIASGKTVSEVADQMALSVKTVSTYRSRILMKMSMKNNAELTRYAIQNDIVE